MRYIKEINHETHEIHEKQTYSLITRRKVILAKAGIQDLNLTKGVIREKYYIPRFNHEKIKIH
jgi:hypothetical protein